VNQVTQPTSSMSQTAAFLLDSHVLYEVACFGLSDTLEKVSGIYLNRPPFTA